MQLRLQIWESYDQVPLATADSSQVIYPMTSNTIFIQDIQLFPFEWQAQNCSQVHSLGTVSNTRSTSAQKKPAKCYSSSVPSDYTSCKGHRPRAAWALHPQGSLLEHWDGFGTNNNLRAVWSVLEYLFLVRKLTAHSSQFHRALSDYRSSFSNSP